MSGGFPSEAGKSDELPAEAPLPDDATEAADRAVIAAQSPLAPQPHQDETTEAGQDVPAAASSLPTQRPEPAKPSPFAGLLAEADAARTKKTEGETEPITAPAKTRASIPAPAPAAAAVAPAPVPVAPSTQEPAQRSLGAYRVLSELGSGGMAVVYKALQPALDRLVAIKELRAEYVSDKQIAARFEREATSLGTLQHGNIVHIYDFIRDVDTAYIVMEFVDGIDLFDLLHDVGKLPPDVAAILALQTAEGLEYAHYHSIIHRDVKPSNLLISKFGEVKIMDFGIARDPGRSDLTQVGMSLGTPAYMAPEQIRGDKIDFRADIFAFGIVLYEMLTGKKPWGDEEGTSIARKVLYEDYTPPLQHNPDLPGSLVRILELCLHKEPERRFQSTHEVRRSLEAYLTNEISIDPRQRLVVFLRNRGIITEGDASSFVHASVLYDGVLKRRDLGLPSVPPRTLLRPVMMMHGALLAAMLIALVIGLVEPFSGLDPRPRERPVVQIASEIEAPEIEAQEAEPDVIDAAPAEEDAPVRKPRKGKKKRPRN